MQETLVSGRRLEMAGKCVLVLGAAGMVGRAVCHGLLAEKPEHLVVHSLAERESEDTAAYLRLRQDAVAPPTRISCEHGNVLVRDNLKTFSRTQLSESAEVRAQLIEDLILDLSDDNLHRMFLWQLVTRHRPHIVIDCVNTATAIAYQNVYQTAGQALEASRTGQAADMKAAIERLLCSLYVPQLVRHVQILNKALRAAGTEFYLKVGTTGTGGMGLNIPYTHGEDKPSKQLMSKSALAGAHTLLLYLMYASPEPPITREIKPAAAIGWKSIGYGSVLKAGKPVNLYDCDVDNPFPTDTVDTVRQAVTDTQRIAEVLHEETGEVEQLASVWIDMGENGVFSRGEFTALTTQNQMEFVTPEEVAASVIYEIRGSNTGTDVLSALRAAAMAPSYRAGFLRSHAISAVQRLEQTYGETAAFENLGPPRLSKLLFEAFLLKSLYRSIDKALKQEVAQITADAASLVTTDGRLRSTIISVGIPILLSDGKGLLRGPTISTPEGERLSTVPTNEELDSWARDGWVDLRQSNWAWWKERLGELKQEMNAIPSSDRDAKTSCYSRTNLFWSEEMDIGEVVGWLFIHDEHGTRRGYQY